MGCCGLCRPTNHSTATANKNISSKKIETIDVWIDSIQGPHQSIAVPAQAPSQPKAMTNAEEIAELQKTTTTTTTTIDRNVVPAHRKASKAMHYLASEFSVHEEVSLASSKSASMDQF